MTTPPPTRERRDGFDGLDGLGHHLALALAAALTTWAATWAWRGFSVDSSPWLVPLLLLAVLVAVGGAVGRWARVPGPLLVVGQVAGSGLVAVALVAGTAVPGPGTVERLVSRLRGAVASAQEYAAPVPADAPSIAPLLVLGGLACLVLVDLLAGTLRRAALAGLPLLTVYALPVSMLGDGAPWPVFALVAVGYLLVLALQEDEQVERWGRGLAGGGPAVLGRPLAARLGAAAVGAAVTVLALLAPVSAPSAGLTLFEGGLGPGGDGEIELDDPMVDLRRDLRERDDVPLLRVRTDDPDPDYLRITVLERFSDNAWTSGGRDLPDTQRADGSGLPATGVDAEVAARSDRFAYAFEATDALRSEWLPVPFPLRSVDAPGNWKYDLSTLDVLATDEDGGLTTAGLSWSATGLEPAFDEAALDDALPGSDLVDPVYTELPELPALVTDLAREAAGDGTALDQAKALQAFFRVGGDFQYTLEAPAGNGSDDLVAFLTDDADGRRGYCEQFASAMAVMARVVGIPSRVAMGFLEPTQVAPGEFEYSTDDLHAWPELFFAGQGWVRFEPTPGGPGGRAQVPPPWTVGDAPAPAPAAPEGQVGVDPLDPDRGGAASPAPAPDEAPEAADARTDGDGTPWRAVVLTLLTLALLVAVALVPRALHRARTRRRWADAAQGRAGVGSTAWRALQDGCRDLGVAWPGGRSPAETRRALGPALASGPVSADAALARLARLVEHEWYAAPADAAPAETRGRAGLATDARRDTELVLEAVASGVSPRARVRAEWAPRSVLRRDRGLDHPVGPVLADQVH
ncbi:transglutaminaseTgpA domain-containing protein [Nocardioides perillae]|uniref:Transglutaminase-like putative cysteine protease n=1 Tax=Nocardioides perillae TaxID=1119534 RepID=A0A7Y9RX96_9ACTN|nr:transglutaminase-like putative cysteine protease [Nocardioides perillae]